MWLGSLIAVASSPSSNSTPSPSLRTAGAAQKKQEKKKKKWPKAATTPSGVYPSRKPLGPAGAAPATRPPSRFLYPLPPLKMPQGHQPPSATCLPATTMRFLTSLALALIALEAALALAPALNLPGRPRRVVPTFPLSRCAPKHYPDLTVWRPGQEEQNREGTSPGSGTT